MLNNYDKEYPKRKVVNAKVYLQVYAVERLIKQLENHFISFSFEQVTSLNLSMWRQEKTYDMKSMLNSMIEMFVLNFYYLPTGHRNEHAFIFIFILELQPQFSGMKIQIKS